MTRAGGDRPPAAALVLGLAGLLPLLGVILVQLVLRHAYGAPAAFLLGMYGLGYAALILSFLGGMWWSAACNRLSGALLWRWLGIAVLPSLWAAAGFLMHTPRGVGVVLAAGMLFALAADRAALAAGLVPAWWMRLRLPLSCGLGLETLAVAWLN